VPASSSRPRRSRGCGPLHSGRARDRRRRPASRGGAGPRGN